MQATTFRVCAYTPFGYAVTSRSSIGFNGELRDPVSDLYLLGNGHRAFSSALMRFLSPDDYSPFGQGGLNTYSYCLGDPVNMHDPEGTTPTVWGAFFGTFKRLVNADSTKPVNFTPARNKLAENINTGSEFGKAVAVINRALPDDTSAPGWKLDKYIEQSWSAADRNTDIKPPISISSVKRPSTSNTTNFGIAAADWTKVALDAQSERSAAKALKNKPAYDAATQKLGSALAGVAANLGGFFMAPAYDRPGSPLKGATPAAQVANTRSKK